MPLPAPELDTLRFQDIVDDAKRKIGLRCPEWTEHNVSDPGVTLLELFAYMTEAMTYRMNQVPERMYIRFLDMLGVTLEPPSPARTPLRFLLEIPIEDTPDSPLHNKTLPARKTVAASLRTEFDEAIEFLTEEPLTLVRPALRHVVAFPATGEGDDKAVTVREAARDGGEKARFFLKNGAMQWREDDASVRRAQSGSAAPMAMADGPFDQREWRRRNSEATTASVTQGRKGWPIFADTPQPGDTLWFGFEEEVARNIVRLDVACVTSAATGLDETFPAQVWEAWNPAETRWVPLDVLEDTTRGFNRPGQIQLVLPARLDPARVADVSRARWIRCRYTTDVPPRPDVPLEMQRAPSPYSSAPQILAPLVAATIGGVAMSANAEVIEEAELGVSDGSSGQIFALRGAPILARTPDEFLSVGPQPTAAGDATTAAAAAAANAAAAAANAAAAATTRETWREVKTFALSGPDDRHYMIDDLSGELRLGPQARDADGIVRQYGKTPERGQSLLFTRYRVGGGAQGNVRAHEITILKSDIPYVASVTNPTRALGGGAAESLDHAKLRAQRLLRLRDRAVTAEDFESLTLEADTAVGRAHCLPSEAGSGSVRLLLVPALNSDGRVPTPRDLQIPDLVSANVRQYLDERRLLTTRIVILDPDYVFVSTDIDLVAAPDVDTYALQRAVRETLNGFFHPTRGGFDGSGWPFGRALSLSDLYTRIQGVRGIAYFKTPPRLFVSRLVNDRQGVLGAETEHPLESAGSLNLEPGAVLCTRIHRVQVRALASATGSGGGDGGAA